MRRAMLVVLAVVAGTTASMADGTDCNKTLNGLERVVFDSANQDTLRSPVGQNSRELADTFAEGSAGKNVRKTVAVLTKRDATVGRTYSNLVFPAVFSAEKQASGAANELHGQGLKLVEELELRGFITRNREALCAFLSGEG